MKMPLQVLVAYTKVSAMIFTLDMIYEAWEYKLKNEIKDEYTQTLVTNKLEQLFNVLRSDLIASLPLSFPSFDMASYSIDIPDEVFKDRLGEIEKAIADYERSAYGEKGNDKGSK